MQNKRKPLTIGELSKRTSTPYYVIQYLDRIGKLPKEIPSTGKGRANIYSESAIDIILEHVNRNGGESNE